MKIEVLGSGCAKCKKLEENVQKALKETGVKADVIKVQDIQEIVDRGIMFTPALIVDGDEKVVGRVASVDEIKKIIAEGK